MATLQITDGPGLGKVYQLDKEMLVIGREAGCELKLEDGKASRSHAKIRRDGPDRYLLRDLGSSNGTLLNLRRVSGWQELRDQDEIVIGQTTLIFQLRDASPRRPDGDEEEAPETIIQVMETQSLPIFASRTEHDEHVSALRFLLDLARTAEQADRPEDLARVLAEGVVKAVPADRVLLFVGKDDSMRPVTRKLPRHLKRIYGQPYSTSVIRQVVEKHVAVMSSLNEDERFKDAMSVMSSKITSAICVPLLAGDELLGALYLDRLGEAELFNSGDLELATAAGLQCSMALLNIKRLDELRAARDRLEAELTGPSGFIGESQALKPVYDFIERVAPTDAGVLILGESGTGKELVARAIHKASPRAERPFVIVNCAALAESLAEAELFGHERGAFTGADKSRPGRFLAADRGTIFLDEIGELSEPIQAKLLRVLEEGEVSPVGEAGVRHIDVRVVAATNRDLAAEVERGNFRRDLYYRLNILRVELPPLRLRGDDVRLLVTHFVDFFGQRCGRPGLRVSEEVLKALCAYPWPGNVRELKNAVERMVILARGQEIVKTDLPPEIAGEQVIRVQGGPGGLRPISEVEREHILAVLEQVNGNKKRAAEILGIDRSTLYAKLRQYGAMAAGDD